MNLGSFGFRAGLEMGECERMHRRWSACASRAIDPARTRGVLAFGCVPSETVATTNGCSVKPGEEAAGQAIKCARWMPRHRPAKKDVASCDKLRGAASKLRSGDFRMGKPGGGDAPSSRKGGQPGELKHLSTRRKRNQRRDSLSSGERKGKSPNRGCGSVCGVEGPRARRQKR